MNKVKSPFVKVLRKAGFSTKEAMNITLDAQFNYSQQREVGLSHFSELAAHKAVSSMFQWDATNQGHSYWANLEDVLYQRKGAVEIISL